MTFETIEDAVEDEEAEAENDNEFPGFDGESCGAAHSAWKWKRLRKRG